MERKDEEVEVDFDVENPDLSTFSREEELVDDNGNVTFYEKCDRFELLPLPSQSDYFDPGSLRSLINRAGGNVVQERKEQGDDDVVRLLDEVRLMRYPTDEDFEVPSNTYSSFYVYHTIHNKTHNIDPPDMKDYLLEPSASWKLAKYIVEYNNINQTEKNEPAPTTTVGISTLAGSRDSVSINEEVENDEAMPRRPSPGLSKETPKKSCGPSPTPLKRPQLVVVATAGPSKKTKNVAPRERLPDDQWNDMGEQCSGDCSEVSGDSLSFDELEDSNSPALPEKLNTVRNRRKARSRRVKKEWRAYQFSEDKFIIQSLCKKKAIQYCMGTAVWKALEESETFKGRRTWHSLSNRFRRNLGPRFLQPGSEERLPKTYEISEADCLKIRRVMAGSHKGLKMTCPFDLKFD